MSPEQYVLVMEFTKKVVAGEEFSPAALCYMESFALASMPRCKSEDYREAYRTIYGKDRR